MTDIYNYQSYKTLANDLAQSGERAGRGVFSRMAEHLDVSPVLISQVLKGDRDFDRDKAYKVSSFFNFSDLETDFYLNLFDWNTATSDEHRKFLYSTLEQKRIDLKRIKNYIQKTNTISEHDAKVYYSSWIYAAVRLSLFKPEIHNIDDISDFLNLSVKEVKNVMTFLIDKGLVVQMNGRLLVSDQHIFIPDDSHMIANHHLNIKNLQEKSIIKGLDEDELCFSGLFISSEKTFSDSIQKLNAFISEMKEDLMAGESEDLRAINFSIVKINK